MLVALSVLTLVSLAVYPEVMELECTVGLFPGILLSGPSGPH